MAETKPANTASHSSIGSSSHEAAAHTDAASIIDLTCDEFFAGIGLMHMGLAALGWRIIFANDFDAKKRVMYEGEFGAAPYLFADDINELDVRSVPAATLATASFPCTDLSLAGSREGLKGKQSSAFWAFTDLLQKMECRPPIVLIENVPGFLTSHGGKDIRAALLTMNRLGYAVDVIIVDAVHFVPHSRARLFIIARRSPTNSNTTIAVESAVRPRAVIDVVRANRDLNWCWRELPALPTRTLCLEDVVDSVSDDDPTWWSDSRKQYLLNQMSERHRKIAEEMIESDTLQYGTIFRRMRNRVSTAELRTDGIAGCLRTPTGGSARQILFVAGKGRCRVRLISPREAARLMGAGSYKIDVSTTNALFGFGDAVCVPVVEWIAKHYLNPLVREIAASFSPDRCETVTAAS